MRRRELIGGLGSTAVAWPLLARAQRTDRMRRIGWLTGGVENDQDIQGNLTTLREGLAKLGWIEGQNLHVELRFGAGDTDRIRTYAAELVSLTPDVLVAGGGAPTRALQGQTQTIPIVMAPGGDVLANGIVKNIARPEGNTTGVTTLYSSVTGKWIELLKQAAPRVERVVVIYNPQLASDGAAPFLRPIEEAARAFAMTAIKLPYRDAIDIVHGIDSFAADGNGGLTVLAPPPIPPDRSTILRLAVQHRLPAIYQDKSYTAAGGMMSYGTNNAELQRRAAYLVDRLLRGAKVSELPVEFPTKFELIINLKAAKAIGLAISEAFLLRADELIE